MKLPEKVVVYGSFQPYVGAMANDSNSEVTRMYYVGDNTYALTVVIPWAGTFDYAVSTYGTLSATYSFDRFPRSGSSNKGTFTTTRDNAVVRFRYRFMDHEVTRRNRAVTVARREIAADVSREKWRDVRLFCPFVTDKSVKRAIIYAFLTAYGRF